MTKLASLITEKYVNIWDNENKRKYIDVVYNMIQNSYKDIGGYPDSKEELINGSMLWKMVKKNGNVVAVRIYKDKLGRKAIALATDGTTLGKSQVMKIIEDDIKLDRSWSEVSGKMETILKKKGAVPIPNKFAKQLLNKDIISLNPDGYHYTRLIGGSPKEKIILSGIPDNLLNKIKDV